MTVDSALQASFFLAAFFCGLLVGLLCSLLQVFCALLGLTDPPTWILSYYARPLPLLKGPLGLPRARRFCRVGIKSFDALTSLLLPSLAACLLILVAFVYNDGVLRPSALLLLLGGFFLWHWQIGKRLARPLAWLAFGVRLLLRYLTALSALPFCLLWRLLRRVLLWPIRRAVITLVRRFRLARTAALCQKELAMARRGFDIAI